MECISLAFIGAFFAQNAEYFLVLWIALEQWIAANKKVKANSATQLLLNMIGLSIKHKATPRPRTPRNE